MVWMTHNSSGVVVLLVAGLAGMREVARRQEQPLSVEYSWQGIAVHWDTADCTHSADCWALHTSGTARSLGSTAGTCETVRCW